MVPGFTGSEALDTSGRYRGASRTHAIAGVALVPQSGAFREVQAIDRGGVDPGGQPATTCTCPCCQTVNGRLYCC